MVFNSFFASLSLLLCLSVCPSLRISWCPSLSVSVSLSVSASLCRSLPLSAFSKLLLAVSVSLRVSSPCVSSLLLQAMRPLLLLLLLLLVMLLLLLLFLLQGEVRLVSLSGDSEETLAALQQELVDRQLASLGVTTTAAAAEGTAAAAEGTAAAAAAEGTAAAGEACQLLQGEMVGDASFLAALLFVALTQEYIHTRISSSCLLYVHA